MEFYCFAIKTKIRREETKGGKIRKVKGKKSVLKKVRTVGHCGLVSCPCIHPGHPGHCGDCGDCGYIFSYIFVVIVAVEVIVVVSVNYCVLPWVPGVFFFLLFAAKTERRRRDRDELVTITPSPLSFFRQTTGKKTSGSQGMSLRSME